MVVEQDDPDRITDLRDFERHVHTGVITKERGDCNIDEQGSSLNGR